MAEKPVDWSTAHRLRGHFLSETSGSHEDYWESANLIELYEETFAQRIAWKWDAVTHELRHRKVKLPPVLIDWGAGTGIAARRCLTTFGDDISEVHLLDRSRLALEFAHKKIATEYPGIKVSTHLKECSIPPLPFTLVVSHVLGELTPAASTSLMKLAARADLILWVEPGTPELSRKLISIREDLREAFSILAPCPHQAKCGLLTDGNERHWCHFFAKPPQEIFHSAYWNEFSKRLGIDLRALPVSFIALQKKTPSLSSQLPRVAARVIGRSRGYKGLVKALICEPTGEVAERSFIKSKHRELCKTLLEGTFQTEIP